MAIVRAVVIDDEKNTTELMKDLLEMHNLQVLGIGYNGNHALRLVATNKPDVVFLDVKMPEMDGIDALKEIKKNYPKTKVIMVTGEKSDELKKLLEEIGADAVIFKPFEMQKLLQVFDMVKMYVTSSLRNQ